jgi:uncharacterized membrane protein
MSLPRHLRNTFLAGILAAIPIVATVVIIVQVEQFTRPLIPGQIPLLGILVAIALIYFLGLFVRSVIGKWMLRLLDRLLLQMPIVKEVYQAWKHVSLTPEGRQSMYSRVVLLDVEHGAHQVLAFTSGECIPGSTDRCCVFVPNAPNPLSGQLRIVQASSTHPTHLTQEEAFKILLSSGNYLSANVTVVRSDGTA